MVRNKPCKQRVNRLRERELRQVTQHWLPASVLQVPQRHPEYPRKCTCDSSQSPFPPCWRTWSWSRSHCLSSNPRWHLQLTAPQTPRNAHGHFSKEKEPISGGFCTLWNCIEAYKPSCTLLKFGKKLTIIISDSMVGSILRKFSL